MMNMSSVEVTSRVSRLRERCISAMPEICIERARFITLSYKETESLPIVIRRAKVAGYSAHFITLDPTVQEDIIARTEHKL